MGFRKKPRRGFDQEATVRDVREVFLGEGLVPLTDELVRELVREGDWREADLLQAQALGAEYHPGRDSLIF